MIRIKVDDLWKRFRRGEAHASLRDLLPALTRRALGQGRDKLDRQDFWALKNFSLELQAGDALGVIGPNGAGKSTLLKVLSRVLRPTKGTIEINGRLNALIEVAAGFHPDLTGRENIFLNGAIMGMSTAALKRRLDEIIEFAGVEQFIDTPVKRYSSGMQARLGFSVAAHLEPDILLVDEILSVGDAQFQRKCVDHMKDRIARGTSVIFISHNMQAVVDLCSRAMVLSAGEITFDGPPALATQKYLELLRDGEVQSVEGPVEILARRFESSTENIVKPGDDFTFEIKVRFRERMERPTFSLLLHRITDQLRLFDVAAQECGLASRTYEAGEVVTVQWKGKLNLLRGVYALGCVVFVPSEQSHAYRDLYMHQFTVHEDGSYAGMVDLGVKAVERA
jgi:lipopolysaccharide transport system ATP-binding protein